MNRSILIMAGGTGGHIFPALAVADVLRAEGWSVTWLGAPNSMEAELVPKHGYPMALVRFSGLRGKGLLRKLMLPLNLVVALWQSAAAIFEHRPDVVLGMGGYITFPGGMMAALLRRPLVIHEQNSVAGLSNKVLGKVADRVMSGFPDVLPRANWCGNPVRASIAALPEPAQRYGARHGRLKVLVVGGSLGAQAINQAVPAALALMPEAARPEVLHQTGKQHHETVVGLYQQAGVAADIRPFIDDMAASYAGADLVICRAGALTVAELAAAGVASLLIPFPHAVDDHQTHNARFLSERGAAELWPQPELNTERLAQWLAGLDREALFKMAQQARSVARTDAAQRVAQACAELAG
ncbi:MAG: undecaprenyldiphospho-muramoylpentapeptide beta-N-acetylglucosaminyltransferase [Gallionella sp.]|nr:undecaprenyldiphospho-muramoylpentapeptide beta-N-acetylglucosaminyltransferase [Gallionella sp.]MDD4946308.1 undecaprenyldiphospho-muramoylpentapeptide beta-N-acetylglucosaminyltransferase [Gallionella sp.]MDD5612348.1 undecaprenyldiphospho-muramoylpentapeptide beta-N-acetylglucosaminyltransferase [Gallionella sp.]